MRVRIMQIRYVSKSNKEKANPPTTAVWSQTRAVANFPPSTFLHSLNYDTRLHDLKSAAGGADDC